MSVHARASRKRLPALGFPPWGPRAQAAQQPTSMWLRPRSLHVSCADEFPPWDPRSNSTDFVNVTLPRLPPAVRARACLGCICCIWMHLDALYLYAFKTSSTTPLSSARLPPAVRCVALQARPGGGACMHACGEHAATFPSAMHARMHAREDAGLRFRSILGSSFQAA